MVDVRVKLKGKTLKVVEKLAREQSEILHQQIPLDAMIQAIIEAWADERVMKTKVKSVIRKVVDNVQRPLR